MPIIIEAWKENRETFIENLSKGEGSFCVIIQESLRLLLEYKSTEKIYRGAEYHYPKKIHEAQDKHLKIKGFKEAERQQFNK